MEMETKKLKELKVGFFWGGLSMVTYIPSEKKISVGAKNCGACDCMCCCMYFYIGIRDES